MKKTTSKNTKGQKGITQKKMKIFNFNVFEQVSVEEKSKLKDDKRIFDNGKIN